eukprot:12653390-Prorocentrum_lima.AAC.1
MLSHAASQNWLLLPPLGFRGLPRSPESPPRPGSLSTLGVTGCHCVTNSPCSSRSRRVSAPPRRP